MLFSLFFLFLKVVFGGDGNVVFYVSLGWKPCFFEVMDKWVFSSFF